MSLKDKSQRFQQVGRAAASVGGREGRLRV